MSTRTVSGGDLTPEQWQVHRVEHILRRDGGSPDSALEGLATIVEDETWRRVPSNGEGSACFDSFRAFVVSSHGLRYSVEQLSALLHLRHSGEGNAEMRERMAAMRSAVAELLKIETEALAEHGSIGRGRNRDGATNSSGANTSGYVLGRLKRDDEALANRVVKGEISANAAALQAGIRKPRIVVTSPESVARSLRKHMSPADLATLAELLAGDE